MADRRRLYLQSPVGNRAPTEILAHGENAVAQGISAVTGWSPYWYGSGTMALAVAVKLACVAANDPKPKVALAAYGCPDVVAAIQFAGAEPMYIDLEQNRLNMDPVQLIRALEDNPDICAVIGTDLFGVSENWDILKSECPGSRPLLIQDCAQSMQYKSVFCDDLHGDMIIFSFGRGKPVCLLGGGALLVSDSAPGKLSAALKLVNHAYVESRSGPSRAMLAAYNLLINPRLYAMLAMMMGDRLGETKFTALTAVERLSKIAAENIDAAIEWYWSHHRDKYSALAAALSPLLHEFRSQISALAPTNTQQVADRIYLRLALLVHSPAERDELARELVDHGIAATAMYKQVLPDIVKPQDVPSSPSDYPVARRLSETLLTLPVHNRVCHRDINVMIKVIGEYARRRSRSEVTR